MLSIVIKPMSRYRSSEDISFNACMYVGFLRLIFMVLSTIIFEFYIDHRTSIADQID